MSEGTMFNASGIILLIVGLPVCAGLLVLQVFLSRGKPVWPGLILPVLNGAGVVALCARFIYLVSRGDRLFITQNGIERILTRSLFLNAIFILLLLGFTAAHIAILLVQRRKRRQPPPPEYTGPAQEIKKMNIQDL